MEDCNEQEILGIINDLQNGKASDSPIVTIKVARTVISPYLTTLFCIWNFSKISKITPIHKKGNKELIENYRPVPTLPVFGKIFEKLIYSRVYRFLTYKGILSDAQFGFRKGHSTAHAIHYSADIVKSALENKKHVLGIFIDLSKAFNTIDHKILIRKLENCGIRGIANDLFKSFLSDREQFTCFLEEKSTLLFMVSHKALCWGPYYFNYILMTW